MAGKSTITIDQHGGMRIEETGFTGNACAKRTEDLIKGIGAKAKAETKKPEYYSKVQDLGRNRINR